MKISLPSHCFAERKGSLLQRRQSMERMVSLEDYEYISKTTKKEVKTPVIFNLCAFRIYITSRTKSHVMQAESLFSPYTLIKIVNYENQHT